MMETKKKSMDKITANMGIGYMVNDMITVGLANGGEDATGEGTYDIFARYNIAQWKVLMHH